MGLFARLFKGRGGGDAVANGGSAAWTEVESALRQRLPPTVDSVAGYESYSHRGTDPDLVPVAAWFVAQYRYEHQDDSPDAWKRAVDALRAMVDRFPEAATADEALYRMSITLARSGDAHAAESMIKELEDRYPRSRHLEPARELSDLLRESEVTGGQEPTLPPVTRHLYSTALWHLTIGKPEDAFLILEKLLNRADSLGVKDAPLLVRARLMQVRLCLDSLQQAERATSILRGMLEGREGGAAGPQASHIAFLLGEAEQARGRWTDAVEAYKQFIRTFPRDGQVDRAQLLIGECLDGAGERRAARAAYGLVVANYPDSVWVPAARSRLAAIDRAAASEAGVSGPAS